MSVQSRVFPPEARDLVGKSRAYLSISLSNRLTASPSRLLTVLRWMRRNVAQFDVFVGDYFHRHNLQDLESRAPGRALADAIATGRLHAQRVRATLDKLGLDEVGIRRASDLSDLPSFKTALRNMQAAHDSNTRFAALVNEGTLSFLQRLAPERIGVEAAIDHSRSYQLEELAAFLVLAGEGYTTNVYAGAHLPVMKALVGGEVTGVESVLRNIQLVELRLRGGA